MTRAIDEVHWNGIYWKDLDWKSEFHTMKICDECGIDGGDWVMGGHLFACRYNYRNQETPAGRAWLQAKIKQLWGREQAAKEHARFLDQISEDHYLVD